MYASVAPVVVAVELVVVIGWEVVVVVAVVELTAFVRQQPVVAVVAAAAVEPSAAIVIADQIACAHVVVAAAVVVVGMRTTMNYPSGVVAVIQMNSIDSAWNCSWCYHYQGHGWIQTVAGYFRTKTFESVVATAD